MSKSPKKGKRSESQEREYEQNESLIQKKIKLDENNQPDNMNSIQANPDLVDQNGTSENPKVAQQSEQNHQQNHQKEQITHENNTNQIQNGNNDISDNFEQIDIEKINSGCTYKNTGECIEENCKEKHDNCLQFQHTQQCSKRETCQKFHRKVCYDYRKSQTCRQGKECKFVHKDCKKQKCCCCFYHPKKEIQEVYNVQYSFTERVDNEYLKYFEIECFNCKALCLPAYLHCGHSIVCRVCVDKERGGDDFVEFCPECTSEIEGNYVI